MSNIKKHGGARPNAGRPKNSVQKTVFRVRLLDEEANAIKIAMNTSSLSVAIQKMLREFTK